MKQKQTDKVRAEEIRETLKRIVRNEIETLPDRLEAMKPQERARFLLSILPYVAPRVNSVEMDAGQGWVGWDD